MAFSLFKLDKKDAAIDTYKKVLSIDPENKQAKDNLAILEKPILEKS